MKSNQRLFFKRGENRSIRRKTSHSRIKIQSTPPTYGVSEYGTRSPGIVVDGKRSQYCANSAHKGHGFCQQQNNMDTEECCLSFMWPPKFGLEIILCKFCPITRRFAGSRFDELERS